MPGSKTYEKITELLGSGFKVHDGTFSDLIFKGSKASYVHLLDKLKSIPRADRPKLLGFFLDKTGRSIELHLIFDFGESFPKTLLFVDFDENDDIPTITDIWPHSVIWELEAMATSHILFTGLSPGGISWHSV